MVRHLLMVVRLGPQSRVGLVPVEEPERSSWSPRAEIRVADGTQENSQRTPAKCRTPLERPRLQLKPHDAHQPTQLLQKTYSLRIASYFYGPPRTGR